ncbi:50S ribosomal protein L4 [Patescibacteria group bacterium]|nr:50S ribosomal protein L4 [Patescibacteria group bacterium]MBU4512677.1 50S ribosomal protein L4 [Patescibacteria group bacterium]MCG2693580.1 50S ribosomal protein L4 [Candidatus Parcubacteria bacterium]
MPKVTVYNQEGVIVGSQELSDEVFGIKPKVEVVHQVVVGMMANKRQVLAHTKDRGEVRGGGKKPWRQKGTGRARHGSIRSPLWVGGGVTFGPTKERNFKKRINKKMRRKAILMCLSDRVNDDKLVLLDKIKLDEIKTRRVVELVDKLRKVFYGEGEVNKVSAKGRPAPGWNKVNKEKEVQKQETRNKKLPLGRAFGSEAQARRELEAERETKESNEKKTTKEKSKKILMLIDKKDEKIQRSCRNIPWLSCIRAQDVNVLEVLSNEYILTSVNGVKKIEEIFTK